MDQLSGQALEWALTHISKFGDTDIFPIPFEFAAIKHDWQTIKPHLQTLDLANYTPRVALRKLISKPTGGFRVAVQLEPLDSLIYAALIYEMGTQIENSRVPRKKNVVYSYRIDIRPDGSLFDERSGWSAYHEQAKKLAHSGEFTHVVVADIADFYNQIYHHRVENALEIAGVEEIRAKNVEQYLSRLTAKQSRGVPVGPYPSIVLAEASLNDVDLLLIREGYNHIRYVDDFRIFCQNRRDAITVLHKLTEYMYTAHRFSLAGSKTKILSTAQFIEYELREPEEAERERTQEKINAISFDDYLQSDPIIDIDEDSITREALIELFNECLQNSPLNLGMARYILRRAKAKRSNILAKAIFENLETLTPVFRDVAEYIKVRACIPSGAQTEYSKKFLAFLKDSDFSRIPYIQMWGLDVLINNPQLDQVNASYELAKSNIPELGLRPLALICKRDKIVDWIRSQKETWMNNNNWDRRALILAASVLPKDERKSWLNLVSTSGDPVERAVALYTAEIASRT